ncbi:hypothetical protein, partial [Vibrio marinisediminis]|uniref:hypothetical protein n=1 Tax=Vibrio marinisediminis TaxID=2758441 RepID=UPI001C7148C3
MVSKLEVHNITTLSSLISHAEAFLNYAKLLEKIISTNIAYQLGICYFNIAEYEKASKIFEQVLMTYKE